jgi:putative phosphoesterase
MRIAIISDIHANIEALEKTFEIIQTKHIDEIVCLGDIIGYGANPNECLSFLREQTGNILLGNHDEAAVDLSAAEYFNPYARIAAEWTSKELTTEHREFIKKLPYTLELNGIFFVHASPYRPQEWHYITSASDAFNNFPYFTSDVCFVGHSHVPGIFCEDIWTQELVRGKKFIINVGSVGQPRDGDPRLSFGILDTELWNYENVRSPYQVQKTAEKIRKAGLPKMLADRLLEGK